MIRLGSGTWTKLLVPIAACLLILAAACGGDDDGDGNGNGNGDGNGATATPTAPADEIQPQPPSPQEVEDQVTEAVDGVIDTEVGDNFFTRNNLAAPVNATVTINIANEGTAIHNMRIAGPDGEWNTDDDVVSDPGMISGGESAVVEFSPSLSGTYTFRCDFHPTEQGGVIVIS